MAGSDKEKAKKKEEEEEAKAEASALGKSLARLSTEEGSGVRVVERIVHGGGGAERRPQLLLQPAPPLVRVAEVHVVRRLRAPVGGPAAAPAVVLDGLVDEGDEAFHP